MKLLEESTSAEIRDDHSRIGARVALTSGVLVLVVGAIIGALLVMSGGDDAASGADNGTADIDLATWVDGASQACAQAVEGDSVLAGGSAALHSAANAADVDGAIRDLAGAVRALPMPTNFDDQERAASVVLLGDEADQAWAGISSNADSSDLAHAADSTDAFVAGLIDIGADCSALS